MRLVSLALVVAAASPLAPADAALSNFDSSVENWSVITYPDGNNPSTFSSYTSLTWNSTGGNPGGYIRQTDDPDGGDTYFLAPSPFLGNQSSSFARSLSFDLFDVYGNEFVNSSSVILVGNGITLCYVAPNVPATTAGAFSHFTVPLVPAAWTVGATSGSIASPSTLLSVLSNLTELAIRGEYHVGPDDMGLDNVLLGAPLAGDANNDGKINADDFALTDRGFAKHLTGYANGDFNTDGIINARDYLILDSAASLTHFTPAPISLIPEPSLLLSCAAPFLIRRRRRR